MYETVLVATDGSDGSRAAIEHALDIAASTEAAVYVLTVVEPENPMRFGVDEVEELDRVASEMVDDIVAAYGDRDVEIHGDVRRGKPAATVLDYAEEIDADLIVAGQHGGDGLSDALLGSTTERLAETTDVPLVVVPADP